MTTEEKFHQAMATHRGQTEEDFELSRKCAVDLLNNHRAMSEEEFRDLTAHLLALLVATR